MLKITFAPANLPSEQALILTVAAGQKLGTQGAKLDRKTGGVLKRAMAGHHFTGAKEQTLTIMSPAKTKLSRIVLAGIGEADKADAATMERMGGSVGGVLGGKDTRATLLVDEHKGLGVNTGEAAAHAAFGALLRSYRFDKYRTKLKPEQKPALKSLSLASADTAKARRAWEALERVAEGVFFTRDLVTEPANILYPETLAQHCNTLKKLGVKVDVLDEKQMKKLGMGSLLGVGQGSDKPPRLVIMRWQGNPSARDKKPIVFVGKGVTFDTGGYSLKPPAGMEKMKYDMAGAGAVIGALRAIAGRKAKANVIGVVGLAENMVSGGATRPGDVVTTMSGQTVEVLNTDAEGRLVLADALWYAQEKFGPKCIIDLATLTGAMVVALGHEYAGLFSNNDALADQLTKAGKNSGETLWRMPMGDAYDKELESPIADMKNIGAPGDAGSITGAQFLQRFIKKGTPWAHLDIAGMAWEAKGRPLCPKGATAFGVRLLNQFVMETAEGK